MWRSNGTPHLLKQQQQKLSDQKWRQNLYGRSYGDTSNRLILPPLPVKTTANGTYGDHYRYGRVSLNYLPSVTKNREISQYRRQLVRSSDEYGVFWKKYLDTESSEARVKYSLPDEGILLRRRLQQQEFRPSFMRESLELQNGYWRPCRE